MAQNQIQGILTFPNANIEFTDWFDQLIEDLPFFQIPRVENEKDWVWAAERLMQNDECIRLNCPWPAAFTDWREWARQWVSALGGAV